MDLKGNSILITGGGSGIGLGLAIAFKHLGNEVIVASRSATKLEHARARGLLALTADMTHPEGISELAERAVAACPRLNVVIHNAGIMVNEKLTSADTAPIITETVATNLIGPMLLTNALLPHLLRQPRATVMTVTSGLAYVPLAMTPTYSATKAAIHSYTQSLRFQLRDTAVEVKELVPPYVRTSLMGERQAQDENAMPLEAFVDEVLQILRERPDADEIVVERARAQRTAGTPDLAAYDAVFKGQNETLLKLRQAEWDKL